MELHKLKSKSFFLLVFLLNAFIIGCGSNTDIQNSSLTSKGPVFDYDAKWNDYDLYQDCFNYKVKKYPSYNGRNAIFLIPETIKTDNFGLYAAKDIKKGAKIIEYKGKIITRRQAEEKIYTPPN